jgi:hypothetical protein
MAEACNISERGRKQRMILGIPLILIGTIASFVDRSFLGQVVAFFGFLSVFQAREGICVLMAQRGAREFEDGTRELLSEDEDIEFFRKRSRAIYIKTFIATLLLILIGRSWLWFRA